MTTLEREQGAYGEGAGARRKLGRREVVIVLPLIAALVAALAAYWPTINSPAFADDYLYFRAVRELSFGEYLRASFTPYANDPVLTFTSSFWRPLYFMSFKLLEGPFGTRPLPYHVLMLLVHLANTTLVWVLARKLTKSWAAAGIAAVAFALHPASADSVAWISSLNVAGLGIALGGWLAFIGAIEAREARQEVRYHWLLTLASLLVLLSMGFRETAVSVVASIGLWYLLVPARKSPRQPGAWLPLVPIVLAAVLYNLLRTRFLTSPVADSGLYDWGSQIPDNIEYLLRLALSPAGETGGWRGALGLLSIAAVLGSTAAALLFRRWLVLALALGFLASIVPFAPITFGIGPRYFYYPAAFLALFVGAGYVEAVRALQTHVNRQVLVPAAGVAVAGILVAGGGYTRARANNWIALYPGPEQAWIDQLQQTYPTLPPGGTLFCTNIPLVLALFDDASLYPTVNYFYPETAHAVHFDQRNLAEIEKMAGPNDRIYIYKPGS